MKIGCLNLALKAGTAISTALIAGAVWLETTQAQMNPHSMPRKYAMNTRAMMMSSWTNMGTQGGSGDYNWGGRKNSYPSIGLGIGGYGDRMRNLGSSPWGTYYWGYGTSGGEGTFVVNGETRTVTMAGPRLSQDFLENVRARVYDPKGKPEENWGVPNPIVPLWRGAKSGEWTGIGGEIPPMATYWPGITAADQWSIYANDLNPQNTEMPRMANYGLSGYIVDLTLPEETIIAQWVDIRHGVQITRRVYNWSHPDFNDFYIQDLTFTNTGDFDGDGAEDNPGGTATLQELYFGFMNIEECCAYGTGYGHSRNPFLDPDDIYYYTDAAGYPGVFPPGMRASIWRDADNPRDAINDLGDPWFDAIGPSRFDIGQTEGQPRSPSHYAMVPLAFRNGGESHTFNDWDQGKYVDPQGEQPYAARYWNARGQQDFDYPYTETHSQTQLSQIFTEKVIQDNPDENNPAHRTGYIHVQIYGPYTLQPGESGKTVMAWVAGHPAQMVPDHSQPGTYHMDYLAWDQADRPSEDKQQDIVTLGEQALLENAQMAHFTYQASYQIPPAPTNAFIPPADLTASENAHQLIRWSDKADQAVNPLTGEQDILGHRVYRSTHFGYGPWELHDTIKPGESGQSNNGKWTHDAASGMYEYEDLDSAAGFTYHYSVRPFAKGYSAWTSSDGKKTLADIPSARVRANVQKGYESGWGPQSARTYTDGREPFQPVTPELERLDKQVVVVPNPYRADGEHQYPNQKTIRFVNLPSKCKVYIYSASGDRVRTLAHDDPTRGERPFFHLTGNLAGDIPTGFYHFVVVSEVPGSEGKVQRGAFVVIK